MRESWAQRLSCDATRGFGYEQQDEEEAESVGRGPHVSAAARRTRPDLVELGCIREPGLSQHAQCAVACPYLDRERREREQHESTDEEQREHDEQRHAEPEAGD